MATQEEPASRGVTGSPWVDLVRSLTDSQRMVAKLVQAEIAEWERKLDTIGDDAQLANVDLQNVLQKQQQTLQMLSTISKTINDTALAVIRKIGG